MTIICKRSFRVWSLLGAAYFHLFRNELKLGNGVRKMVVCQEILRASDWKEVESKHFAYLRIQDRGQSCESGYFIHLQEGLLVGNIEGRQYWGQPKRKKRPQVSFETSSQWDYVNRLPTDLSAFWVAYLVAGRGKGKSYKLFWFQYFHGARLYLWPHVSIHNDTHTESNSYSSGYWHFL